MLVKKYFFVCEKFGKLGRKVLSLCLNLIRKYFLTPVLQGGYRAYLKKYYKHAAITRWVAILGRQQNEPT
jgi:hypothetical protein